MFESKEGTTKKSQTSMLREHLGERQRDWNDRLKLSIMYSIYPRLFEGRVKAVHGLVRVPLKSRSSSVSIAELHSHYKKAATQLATSCPGAMEKTSAERMVRQALKEMGVLYVVTSMWVGRKNIDLMAPGLTGLSMGKNRVRFTGVAIEVDGPSHNFTPKFLADVDKDNLLCLIGAIPFRVKNEEIRDGRILEALSRVCTYSAIDSRSRRRLKKRIYLVTVFLNWPLDRLGAVFGFDVGQAVKKVSAALTEVS